MDESDYPNNSSFEFISTLSHDFKTPLTVIKLYADFMLKDLGEIDEISQRNFLSIIKAGADDLNFLLTNARDFQAILLDKMSWLDEEHDISKLINKAAYPISISCQTKGVEFAYHSDVDNVVAVIDAGRFMQIIYNLLRNALKFTEHGGIKISLARCNTSTDPGIHLTVTDSGKGIPKEQLHSLMQAEKKSAQTDPAKSIKMGLPVVKYIVDHYQGRFWAESTLDEGSVFHVELPLQENKSDE